MQGCHDQQQLGVNETVGGSIGCLRQYAKWDYTAVKVARAMRSSTCRGRDRTR